MKLIKDIEQKAFSKAQVVIGMEKIAQYCENIKNKRSFQYFVKTSNGDIQISSPVNQVNRYRRKIMSLYVPEIGEVINGNKRALAVIGIGVYMHKMNTIQAHDFIKGNKYCSVFGNDMLDNSSNISKIIPGVNIPIYSKAKINGINKPIIVLAWNFFKEIKKNNSHITSNFINIKDLEK